jgi:hypothetical protein
VNAFINVYDNLFPLKVAPMFFLLNIDGKIMVDTNCQGYQNGNDVLNICRANSSEFLSDF